MKNKLLFSILALCSFNALSSTDVIIYKNLHNFLKEKSFKLDGKINIGIKEISLEKFNFQNCKNLDFFIPNGNKEVGPITVGIKCLDSDATKPNNVFIQAEIIQEKKYLVVKRKMNVGEEIKEEDLREEFGDVSRFYFKFYENHKDIIGKKIKNSMIENQVVKDSNLMLPVVIQYNQNVMVIEEIGNSKVSAFGNAMGLAYEGQQVKVRMPSKKILLGIAQADGTVRLLKK